MYKIFKFLWNHICQFFSFAICCLCFWYHKVFNFERKKTRDSFLAFSRNVSLSPCLWSGVMHISRLITVTRSIFKIYTEIGSIERKKDLGKCPLSEKFWNDNAYNPHYFTSLFQIRVSGYFLYKTCKYLTKKKKNPNDETFLCNNLKHSGVSTVLHFDQLTSRHQEILK